jgi:hypothetical protein
MINVAGQNEPCTWKVQRCSGATITWYGTGNSALWAETH